MTSGSPSCQVLIVGGGLAGLEVAAELSRLGAESVAVVEAGPALDLRHVNVTHGEQEALRLWLEPGTDPSFHRPWSSGCPPHYEGASGLRRRIGGRSLYWYGIALPVEEWALAAPEWPDAVVDELARSWRGGASLYERTTEWLEAWRGEPLDGGVPPVALDSLALRRTPRAVRPAATPGRWYAYSPLDAWRDPITGGEGRAPAAIELHPETEVTALLVDDDGAAGALVRDSAGGGTMEIRADTVVLAAGTIENARLGLQALSRHGSGSTPVAEVVDHLVQGVFLRLDPPGAARLLELIGEGSWYTPCPEERSNLFLDLSLRPSGEAVVELQMTGEQVPSEASRISWDTAAGEPWSATVHCERTDAEVALVLAQQRRLQEAWEALAARINCEGTQLRFADYDVPESTNALLLASSIDALPLSRPQTWCNQLGTEDHEGCTLPMGRLLGDRQELLGVPGVFVAGPATLPRLGAANPALTTIALSHRLAAILAERG